MTSLYILWGIELDVKVFKCDKKAVKPLLFRLYGKPFNRSFTSQQSPWTGQTDGRIEDGPPSGPASTWVL